MSLDKNLFTLHFTPHQEDANVLDLVDPGGIIHYRKQRVPQSLYEIQVYDPLSQSLLITATGSNAIAKTKVLQLHNPSIIVELKSTSRVSFKWTFQWEDHEFEWRKDECFMIRKPDPPVLVAVTSEPPSRIKAGQVQIMDYNLNRFDIEDRKGLEIVMLTALFTFQDLNETYHATPSRQASGDEFIIPLLGNKKSGGPVPIPPPRPEPRVGLARITEMQAYKGDPNEVVVEEEGEVSDYARYCWDLLKDDAMLFITIRSSTAAFVPKVLHVVEQTKRIRHKSGVKEEEELFQYVIYEQENPKGPKRINLDDSPSGNPYKPPSSLAVHLSKIDMPELKPKTAAAPESSTKGKRRGKSGERNKEQRHNERDRDNGGPRKDRSREKIQKAPPPVQPPSLNKNTRPAPSPPPENPNNRRPRYPSNAPQPSPAQLGNPSAFGAIQRLTHGRVPSNGPPTLAAPQPSSRPLSGFFDRFSSKR